MGLDKNIFPQEMTTFEEPGIAKYRNYPVPVFFTKKSKSEYLFIIEKHEITKKLDFWTLDCSGNYSKALVKENPARRSCSSFLFLLLQSISNLKSLKFSSSVFRFFENSLLQRFVRIRILSVREILDCP